VCGSGAVVCSSSLLFNSHSWLLSGRNPTYPVAQILQATSLFRNGDCTHRRWKIAARAHPIPDLVEVTPQIFVELFERLIIHAGCATIGPDRFIRFVHTLLLDKKRLVCRNCRHHPVSSCSVSPTHLIRPLCSGPITGPSTLIQVSPPQTLAS